jgi:pyrroloquinoline quinone (PQQ) biosynthesis protein C
VDLVHSGQAALLESIPTVGPTRSGPWIGAWTVVRGEIRVIAGGRGPGLESQAVGPGGRRWRRGKSLIACDGGSSVEMSRALATSCPGGVDMVRGMPDRDLRTTFDRAICGRYLLDHPYYQRWQDGLLSAADLAHYAEQYRHVERCLPGVLSAIAEQLDEGAARDLVEENLSDELSRPRPHAELFEAFADAVGADKEVEPTAATRHLISRYEQAASADPVAAMAVIGAYEVQAAQVAATKGDALRRHHQLGAEGTEFWDVHAELEQAHATWTVEALCLLGASLATVLEFATTSAEAWWAFLDEQDMATSQ